MATAVSARAGFGVAVRKLLRMRPPFYMEPLQMRASFDNHRTEPGHIQVNEATPAWIRKELRDMGYTTRFAQWSTGPITAVLIDRKHGTFWGAAGNHGEDYGIAW